MLKMIVTGAVISKGYENSPALRFSENGEAVRFRIGERVYDKRAQDNLKWINLSVRAFGPLCERIKKMEIKEGSYVNIIARYDEETWEDQATHEQKTTPALIVDEIEYCYSGKEKKKENGSVPNGPSQQPQESSGAPSGSSPQENDDGQEMPDSFKGFESFGGANPFFPQD